MTIVPLLFVCGVLLFCLAHICFGKDGILKPKKINVICEDEQFRSIILNQLSELDKSVRYHLRHTTIQVLDNVPEYDNLTPQPGSVTLGLHIAFNHGPDKIELYRNNILLIATQPGNSLRQCVRRALLHEIGHHFGYDHKKLDSFGL